eukprot:CAMPEP_0203785098 /NCGR_PEP_ID=MMETSP0100_2-20121128/835_1 /ASSEMBLY_ACC=CAM_ASM_000210 /TAXON_ID=96639 /ORGANISM=" , Strain NY0313808BC1" /LENGTH=128 /DNA_ID=CAMNT_0050687157 /DNA_START=828 /DNA_END=1214 /DNA_ORIENTATION=+
MTLYPRPLMINPWKSTSLREFWGARWDTGVQAAIVNNSYRPIRKLGFSRGLAMFGTFAFSGLIHCAGLWELGSNQYDLALMFLYFMVQGAMVALEIWFDAKPNNFRTMLLLFMSGPLFVFPVLNRMGL